VTWIDSSRRAENANDGDREPGGRPAANSRAQSKAVAIHGPNLGRAASPVNIGAAVRLQNG